YPSAFPSTEALRAHVETAREVYAHGSFSEVLAFRIGEARGPIAALIVSIAPRTLGLFVLGAYVWRSGILRPPRSRPLFAAVAVIGVVAGGIATWAADA